MQRTRGVRFRPTRISEGSVNSPVGAVSGGEHPARGDERAPAEGAAVQVQRRLVGELAARRLHAVDDARAGVLGRALCGTHASYNAHYSPAANHQRGDPLTDGLHLQWGTGTALL